MLKALKKLYEELNIINPDIMSDYDNDYLTEHTARNGRPVMWYLEEGREAAIYTDTCELLTQEEIKNELM